MNISMKFQIAKAQDLSGKLSGKPYFSNKHARGDSKIMLTEYDKMLLKNQEVGKVFNQYFGHITDSIEKVCEGLDDIDNIVYEFRNHPSIVKITEQYKVNL